MQGQIYSLHVSGCRTPSSDQYFRKQTDCANYKCIRKLAHGFENNTAFLAISLARVSTRQIPKYIARCILEFATFPSREQQRRKFQKTPRVKFQGMLQYFKTRELVFEYFYSLHNLFVFGSISLRKGYDTHSFIINAVNEKKLHPETCDQ